MIQNVPKFNQIISNLKIREKFKDMESGVSDETNSSHQSRSSTDINKYKDEPMSRFSLLGSSSSSSNIIILSRSSFGGNSSTSSSSASQRSVSPRTLNSRMDAHIVRRILDSNLMSRESIRHRVKAS